MRNLRLRNTSLRLVVLAGVAGLPLTAALGHEGHHAECNQTAINALEADIQAMGAGEAKTTATKEMEAAQQMMARMIWRDARATSTAPWRPRRSKCLAGAPEGVQC